MSEERQRHGLSFLEYIGAAPKWSLERKPVEEQRQVRDVLDAVIRRPSPLQGVPGASDSAGPKVGIVAPTNNINALALRRYGNASQKC